MVHTFRLKAGDNAGAAQYEVGYCANNPDAANPGKFTVQQVVNTPIDAKHAVTLQNKTNPGQGHPQ